MDGIVTGIHGGKHGWSMHGTVTVASTDTLTGDKLGVHPWMVHGWSMDGTVTVACLPPSVKLSMDASYCVIDGTSYHLLSKYPWMLPLLCHPWTIHGWTPSLSRCPSMDGHINCAIHGYDRRW